MAFDDLKAELALLINQMETQPEDPHELYLQIREKLNEMRAFGMPLPEDLRFALSARARFQLAPGRRLCLARRRWRGGRVDLLVGSFRPAIHGIWR